MYFKAIQSLSMFLCFNHVPFSACMAELINLISILWQVKSHVHKCISDAIRTYIGTILTTPQLNDSYLSFGAFLLKRLEMFLLLLGCIHPVSFYITYSLHHPVNTHKQPSIYKSIPINCRSSIIIMLKVTSQQLNTP